MSKNFLSLREFEFPEYFRGPSTKNKTLTREGKSMKLLVWQAEDFIRRASLRC